MKKSTKYIIASFAVAVVAALVMGIAAFGATTAPETVTADGTRTYYLYNNNYGVYWDPAGTDICCYAYNNADQSKKNAEFPGEAMSSLGNGWFSITVSDVYDRLIFVAQSWGSDKQTVDITQGSNNVFWFNGWDNGKRTVEKYQTSADPSANYTYHVFNTSSFSAPHIHCYNSVDSGLFTTTWPGYEMTAEGDGWFTVSVPGIYDKFILSDNGSNQWGAVDFDSSKAYYYGGWYETKADAGYYLIGDIQGWSPSDKSYNFDYVNTVSFCYRGIAMTEGDEFKFGVHGGYDNDFNSGNNITVPSTGIYDIFINNYDHSYILSKVDEEALDIQELRGKVSKDGNYLLLISAFDLTKIDGSGSYKLGFTVNGVDYVSNVYYDAVRVKTSEEESEYLPTEFFYEEKGDYFLIVEEIEIPAGVSEYNIRAFVKNGDSVVSSTERKTVSL